MKKYWYLVFLLSFTATLHSQSFQSTVYGVELQSLEYLNEVCPPSSEAGGLGFKGMDKITPASAERIVDEMLSDMGITNKYQVRECKEIAKGNAKAQAFFAEGGIKKYIIYDMDFLQEIANSAETNYAAMFVLAHEVGHHINDHSLNNKGSEVSIELEADYFAGTQLAISGANLEQVLRTPRSFEKIFTGRYDDHPGRRDRMRAAFNGWMKYANNDSLLLNANATYIKDYHDEMDEYQKQWNERNKPKPTTANNTNTTTSEPIEKPGPVVIETKEQKEQKGAAEILQDYFKALGGLAKVNAINSMSYIEKTKSEGSDGYIQTFDFQYDQRTPTLMIITNNIKDYEGEQYKISNDSVYYRLIMKDKWKEGVPPNGPSEKEFKEMVGSSTGNFLEDFKLFASPSLVALKETVVFEGEECHRLEVKEMLEDSNFDKRGTGSKVYAKQNRYYRLSDGLLHATEIIRKIQLFKKNNPDSRETTRTVTVHKDYQEVDGLQFPMTYKIVKSLTEGPEEFVYQTITKTVGEIEIIFKNKSL